MERKQSAFEMIYKLVALELCYGYQTGRSGGLYFGLSKQSISTSRPQAHRHHQPPPGCDHQPSWQMAHPSMLTTHLQSQLGGKWCGNPSDVQGELTISRTINHLHRLRLRPFNIIKMTLARVLSEDPGYCLGRL